MSEFENQYKELIEFADKMKKEGKEKSDKEKWEGVKKNIRRLYIGMFFAIISPWVGIPMAIYLLRMLHILQDQLQFK